MPSVLPRRSLPRIVGATLMRRVAALVAALVASIAVMGMAMPGDAQAFAFKDVCEITVYNDTGSLGGFRPLGSLLPRAPAQPVRRGPVGSVWRSLVPRQRVPSP
jgi:hypothetical protein